MENLLRRRHSTASIMSTNSSYKKSIILSISTYSSKQNLSAEIPIKCGLGYQIRCCLKSDTKLYLVLYQSILEFYDDHNCENLIGSLNFCLYSFDVKQISDTEINITAFSCKKVLKLRFCENVIKDWIQALENCINRSKGGRFKISRISPREKFWENTGISEEEFLNQAENGDLLLFRSKNSGSLVQRCFTRGKYDHIGLVLRFENNEIGFIEASRAFGVIFTYWDKYFKKEWKNYYNLISYRKLKVRRDPEMILALDNFVQNAKGKNYKLDLLKNRNKPEVIPGNEDTFFCSELVASAYKVMRLLDSTKASYKYYPSHFAGSAKLELLKGSLKQERDIDMNYSIK